MPRSGGGGLPGEPIFCLEEAFFRRIVAANTGKTRQGKNPAGPVSSGPVSSGPVSSGPAPNAPIWCRGGTRSGKTTRLVTTLVEWMANFDPTPPGILVLAATGDGRIELGDRLTRATQGKCPFYATTPLGWFQDEVMLFWPLLIQQLGLTAQFAIRLAPETEQELATQVWRVELDRAIATQPAVEETRLVRRLLDVLQLAALAGVAIADIPTILEQGLAADTPDLPMPFETVAELLDRWQRWCLERGFLTYSVIAGLYWQHLLPHPTYQQRLSQRYSVLLADDVDEYPAIARPLIDRLLDAGAAAVLTFNPLGAVRLGLGADPQALAGLADRCRVEELADRPLAVLEDHPADWILQALTDPLALPTLPATFQVIQTPSRSQLLRSTTDTLIAAVQAGEVAPRDVAIIAPGLDAIARYSLVEILTKQGIAVESLNDQRPLNSVPVVRALLTLLTLVYGGLGRLCDRDAVAEMLVVLSMVTPDIAPGMASRMAPGMAPGIAPMALMDPVLDAAIASAPSQIDPVRAGLLADYCFVPHPDRPRLLPAQTFPRWDRLGYQAATAYDGLIQWIATQQAQMEQRLIPNAVALLDRAIQHFLAGGSALPFGQVSALRQLIETAQHYWDVQGRLNQQLGPGARLGGDRGSYGGQRAEAPTAMVVGRFIQLLRSGIVTANPYPVRPVGPASNAVTLATVFQYRASRRSHRWQFWLDAGSMRWLTGVDALFAAPLFLQSWSGRLWTAADTLDANEARLHRILLDLLGRVEERVILCHSDLATGGQEQTGVLLSLVTAASVGVSGAECHGGPGVSGGNW
jgi:hypothetical protein